VMQVARLVMQVARLMMKVVQLEAPYLVESF
jgi:hypothetical protein